MAKTLSNSAPAKLANAIPNHEACSAMQIARLFSVTNQAVGLWHKRAGCPRNKDGTFNLATVIEWRVQRAAGEKSDESDWKEQGEKYRALTHKHRLEVYQGKFVDADAAAAWWEERVTEARTALQSLGASVSPSLVGQGVDTIRALIHERCRGICDTLARQMEESLTEEEDTDGET